jgi:hypothetical protein
VDGSNPSLLKKSACLFVVSVVLVVLATQAPFFINAIINLTGAVTMETIIHSFKAVIFATTQSATLIASSVMAGLAANGVTPHLH